MSGELPDGKVRGIMAIDGQHVKEGLHRCTFCDSDQIGPTHFGAHDAGHWAVMCFDCGARGPVGGRETCVVAWNSVGGGKE